MSVPSIDITSYESFRSETIGRGFDVDGFYGYQCWDLCDILWENLPNNPRRLVTASAGQEHYVKYCWLDQTSRAINTGNEFTQITSINNIKRGDVLVLDSGIGGVTGHICFADEDYTSGNYLTCLGQNQVDPSAEFGHITTATNINISSFLGAFRYKAWNGVSSSKSKKQFPWLVMAKRHYGRYK